MFNSVAHLWRVVISGCHRFIWTYWKKSAHKCCSSDMPCRLHSIYTANSEISQQKPIMFACSQLSTSFLYCRFTVGSQSLKVKRKRVWSFSSQAISFWNHTLFLFVIQTPLIVLRLDWEYFCWKIAYYWFICNHCCCYFMICLSLFLYIESTFVRVYLSAVTLYWITQLAGLLLPITSSFLSIDDTLDAFFLSLTHSLS